VIAVLLVALIAANLATIGDGMHLLPARLMASTAIALSHEGSDGSPWG
jgi:hypothetical protein